MRRVDVAVDEGLEGRHLGGELGDAFYVVVEPAFHEVDLVAEVDGSGAEGWGVEGGFFDDDGAGA